MTLWIVLVALVAGGLRGIVQGMGMTKPLDRMHSAAAFEQHINHGVSIGALITQFDLGLRGHRWFGKNGRGYHKLYLIYEAALATLAILLYQNVGTYGYVHAFSQTAVALSCIWLAMELGYAYSRHGEFITSYPENLAFGPFDPDEHRIVSWVRAHWDAEHPVYTYNLAMTLARLTLVAGLITAAL